jgi:multicomponent Na+:H+ antiporter subunit D
VSEEAEEETESIPVSIYHPTYLVLAAGVCNAFLAGDLFNLYVGFEILLAASYVLLTLGGTGERIRAGSIYVVVALLSSIVFLIAIALTYAATGTVNLAQLSERLPDVEPGTRLAIQLLLLLAFGIKAAVFPLSAWLPDSYPTAPAPVTAVFAGLLTKVGVYAILRTQTLLFPTDPRIDQGLMWVALLTMLVGILGAVAQDDIKRLLSFTLVSHIGYMVFGVALGSRLGLSGAIFYALHSMVLMTALYLLAGQAAALAGGFSLTALGGLYRKSGGFAAFSFILFVAACGLPPFSGFWPKVILVRASIDVGAWWLAAAILIGGFLLTVVFGRVFLLAYWRPATAPQAAVSISWQAGLPLFILTAIVVAFGILPEQLLDMAQAAATGLIDPTAYLQSVFPDGGMP